MRALLWLGSECWFHGVCGATMKLNMNVGIA